MTIYDIAKQAGVSASTVSRVINNKPGIKAETRKKIQAILKSCNYTPNENARGLSTQNSKLIGILITDLRIAHHTDIAYHIERELAKVGYVCLILNTGITDENKVEAIQILAKRQVDGILMVGSTFQCEAVKDAIVQYLPSIPIAITNGYLPLPNVKGVLVDEYKGVMECIELMQGKGHKKIALIAPNDTPSSIMKKNGFVEAMTKSDVLECADWIYYAETSLTEGYKITNKIIEEHPDVQGLLFCEDEGGVSAVRALMDAGYSVPDQIAVIGVDNTRYCEMCNPKLTALDNMMLEMSMESARILLGSLQGETLPDKIMLLSKIVERETT